MSRVAVLLILTLACISALTRAEEPAPPPDGRALVADIETLQRLAPLHLTDEQITAILGAYDQFTYPEAEPGFNETTIQGLVSLKARLLDGEAFTDADGTFVKGVRKLSIDGRAWLKDAEGLMAAITPMLTPAQIRALELPQGAGVADEPTQIAASQAIIKLLARRIEVEDAQWPAVRKQVLSQLTAGITDVTTGETARADLEPFLDRLRDLGEDGILERRDELAGELRALMPGGVPTQPGMLNLIVVRADGRNNERQQAALQLRQTQRALAPFLSPNAPRLLREMLAAREK